MTNALISILGALASWAGVWRSWEGVAEARVTRSVEFYLNMVRALQDSGISALLKSDIGGISDKHLWKVISRIKSATGLNPLGPGGLVGNTIERELTHRRKSIRIFLDTVAKKRNLIPTFQEHELMKIIESL